MLFSHFFVNVAMTVGLLQGIRTCEREGISSEQYDAFVREMIPLALDDTLTKVRKDGFADDPSQAECSVSLMAGVARLFAEYCEDVQLEPSLFEALARLFGAGVETGHGKFDWVYAGNISVPR